MAPLVCAAQHRGKTGCVFDNRDVRKIRCAGAKAAKGKRRRNKRRAARERLDRLDRNPMPGCRGKQHHRCMAVGVTESSGLDSALEKTCVPLEKKRRAQAKQSSDISIYLYRDVRHERQHLLQKPAKIEKIWIVGAGDNDRLAAALASRHGVDCWIKQRMAFFGKQFLKLHRFLAIE